MIYYHFIFLKLRDHAVKYTVYACSSFLEHHERRDKRFRLQVKLGVHRRAFDVS